MTDLEGAAGVIDESAVREKFHTLSLLLIERGISITTMESPVKRVSIGKDEQRRE